MSNDHEHLEYWPASPPLWAITATEGFSDWPYLYSIWTDEEEAYQELERRAALDEGPDLCGVACRITERGMEVWNSHEPPPWAKVRGRYRYCTLADASRTR